MNPSIRQWHLPHCAIRQTEQSSRQPEPDQRIAEIATVLRQEAAAQLFPNGFVAGILREAADALSALQQRVTYLAVELAHARDLRNESPSPGYALACLTVERDALQQRVEQLTAERDAVVKEHRKHQQLLEHRTLTLGAAIKAKEAAEATIASLRSALEVIHKTTRGDEKNECWTIRKWLDERGVFNDDIQGAKRLVEALCAFALAALPSSPVSPKE
jgi:hypothetical protein